MPFELIPDAAPAKTPFELLPDSGPARRVKLPPSLEDQEFQAQTERKADLMAQMKEARQTGEYWEGVEGRINNLTGAVVEPLTRPLSGAVGRAADVIVPGPPVIEPTLQQGGIHLPKAGEAETTGGKIAAGTYNAAADLISTLSSPDMVALLPAAASKPVLTAWISQMAGHTPQRVMKANQLFKEGKTQEAVQEVVTGVGELGMAEMGRRHVMGDPNAPTSRDVRPDIIDPRPAQDVALRLTDPRYAQQRVVLPETMREAGRAPKLVEPGQMVELKEPLTAAPENAAVPETVVPVPETVVPVEKTAVPVAEAESPLPERFKSKPVAEITDLVKDATPEEVKALGGPTGFMWEVGRRAKTPEDVAALRKMAEDAYARIDEIKAEGKKQTDPDKAMEKLMEAAQVAGKQPWEAYEYATGVKLDGTPKWTVLEKLEGYKGKTYKPPVPDAQYLKAKGLEEAPATQKPKGAKRAAIDDEAAIEAAAAEQAKPAAPTDLPTDLPTLARLRITKPELRPQIDAKIADMEKAASGGTAFLRKELPPVPAGHVRLFHGEGGPEGGGTGGAFYTSNLAKASTFGPDVSWVDMPTDRAQAAFARAKGTAFAGGDNFVLEPADIQRAQKIEKKVEPPTHVLDEPAAAEAPKPVEVKPTEQVDATPDEQIFNDAFDKAAEDYYQGARESVSEPHGQRVSAEKLALEKGEVLTPEQASTRVEEWKAEAKKMGESGENAGKIILSLFDSTGVWSQPWRDAGFEVVQIDRKIRSGSGHEMDVMKIDREWLEDNGLDMVHGVLAACPCTEFATSGARWFKSKDASGKTAEAKALVNHTLAVIEYLQPDGFWALENPVGRLKGETTIPLEQLQFQPHNYGDPYTKRTQIFGMFNTDLPQANVAPSGGSYAHKLGSKSEKGAGKRSQTFEGFAYSFFMANKGRDAMKMAEEAAEKAVADRPKPAEPAAPVEAPAAPAVAEAPAAKPKAPKVPKPKPIVEPPAAVAAAPAVAAPAPRPVAEPAAVAPARARVELPGAEKTKLFAEEKRTRAAYDAAVKAEEKAQREFKDGVGTKDYQRLLNAKNEAEVELVKAKSAHASAEAEIGLADWRASVPKTSPGAGTPTVTTKQLKGQKEFLLDSLDTAIKDAPEALTAADAPKVTIAVPGDGTFTLINRKSVLKNFRETARKDFPGAAKGAAGPGLPSVKAKAVPKGGEVDAKALIDVAAKYTSTDESRFVLLDSYADGTQIIATDGKQMLRIVSDKAPGTPDAPVRFNREGKENKAPAGKYPNWKQVIPRDMELAKAGVEVDSLFHLSRQAKAMRDLGELDKDKRAAIPMEIVVNPDGSIGGRLKHGGDEFAHNVKEGAFSLGNFNPDFIENAMNAAAKLGNKHVDMLLSPGNGLLVLRGKGMESMMMPVRPGDVKELPLPKLPPPSVAGTAVHARLPEGYGPLEPADAYRFKHVGDMGKYKVETEGDVVTISTSLPSKDYRGNTTTTVTELVKTVLSDLPEGEKTLPAAVKEMLKGKVENVGSIVGAIKELRAERRAAEREALERKTATAAAPRGIAASLRKPGALEGGGETGAISMAPVQAAVDAFKAKAEQNLPRLRDVSRESLPDLGSREANKMIATEPTGVGRVPVLNWLLDPRHRANAPHEKAILTWFYENAMGQAHVQAVGSTFGTRFKQLFPRNERGELNTVRRTRPGQSLHPSDVFEGLQENPNSYVLTPEQRTGFNELMGFERKLRALAKKYKIRFEEESGEFVEGAEGETPYWTRGKTVKTGAAKRSTGGVMLGARQYFQKGRSFKTEAEGVARGFEYPLGVEDRLILRAGRLYKAIADRRLAGDKDLGGRWGGAPTYEEAVVSQPSFQRQFMMDTPTGPVHVSQHKIFPVETANAINKAFGPQGSVIRKTTVAANNLLKGMTLGFDWGVGQIQLLATAYKNPGLWAKANVQSFKAFGSREVFANYVRANEGPIRELAQYGSGVGRLPEMMAGLESGELMTAVPKMAGRAIERAGAPRIGKAVAATAEVPAAFARQFQTFMDVAKVELWKARREVVPKEEWAREIQAIEAQLLSGRMESIGITPGRALTERMLLLAPSYYRGGLNLIGGLAAKGASGQTYRRSMGAYMTGMTATFVGMALAAGLSWDEILKRMNPMSGHFMMVPIKTGKRSIEVGFGGIMRSFMRLGGEMAETSIKTPGNWASLASDKNPVVRWLRAHSAPVPSKVWDGLSGRDYMGEEADIASLGKGSLPLATQQLFGEKQPRTPAGVALEFVGQAAGLSTFPGKTSKQQMSSLYRQWREKQTDPKIVADLERSKNAVLPEGKYKALEDALSIGDEAAAREAITALRAEKTTNKEMKERMRPFSGEGYTRRRKPLVSHSREMEAKFRASLTPEQRAQYEEAVKDRQQMYQDFLKALSK
jgi:hypothetical protein